MPFFRNLSITKKFGLVFLMILTLTISSAYTVYYFQALQRTDGAIIDAAGRNRMLSQKIGFYAEQVVDGDEAAKEILKSTIDLHHISFRALKNGGVAPGIADDRVLPPTVSSIMHIVLKAEELWLEYKKNGETIINEPIFVDGESNLVVKAAMDFIEENAPEMLRRNNEMTKAYVEMNDKKQNDMKRLLMITLTANISMLLFALFIIQRYITIPIKKMSITVGAVTKGKFTQIAEMRTKDEIGDLANAFNQMVEYLKQHTTSIDNLNREISERQRAERAERERELLDKKLMRLNKRLEKLAVKDSHTGLYNYRYLTNIIEAEFERAIRHNNPLSVFMLDLDYFKSINDVYGHQFGDLVLKQLARQLKRTVRRYDIVVRFGGEEFMIISPGTDDKRALILAQRILKTVNEYDFGDEKHTVKLKLTIAVSSYPEDTATKGMDLIGHADQILNKAKEAGGNRVYSSIDLEKAGASLSMQDEMTTAEVKYLKDKIGKLTKRADQSLIEEVFAFAKTIELKDHPSADHLERAAHHATEIAKALNLSSEEIERIRQACILHDLGKIGISEHILIKKLKLTAEEFEEIRKHPQIGVDIIRPIYFLHNIVPFILYHHERWDGKGYPSGLSGEHIPLGARIVAIADVYQALTSERPYRKAYSKEDTIKIIKEASSTQFDPKIVKLFLKMLERETKERSYA